MTALAVKKAPTRVMAFPMTEMIQAYWAIGFYPVARINQQLGARVRSRRCSLHRSSLGAPSLRRFD
jgi:hypothetical protein